MDSANKSLLEVPENKKNNVIPPDYERLVIVSTKDSKEGSKSTKIHTCEFCLEDHTHLKRHMKRKHKNEPKVQDMIKESAKPVNFGKRGPMKYLRYTGDFKRNNNKDLCKGKL